MKIIVAGGAGFIGSHFCERLLKENHDVICVDNFSSGKESNIAHLINKKRFLLDRLDVSLPLEFVKCDFIVHLASLASPKFYLKSPIKTMLANSHGTYNLLSLALENKAGFLLASTSEVYGDPKESPQHEGYSGNVHTMDLRSVYDEAKRYAETLTVTYKREFELDVRIARIFNTYGPRMRKDDGRVIPQFINQALSEKPMTIYESGQQTRSFCYVSDMVEALYRLMMTKKKDAWSPINLGSDDEKSIQDISKTIARLIGKKFKTKSVGFGINGNDPKMRRPDLARAKSLLGWKSIVPLDSGLQKTIEYFKKT